MAGATWPHSPWRRGGRGRRGNLSDRARLRGGARLGRGCAEAGIYLVEIKAAAMDVVCEAAAARGVRVVFCDNRPVALPEGEPDLDAALPSWRRRR